jgi:hypothetical protein
MKKLVLVFAVVLCAFAASAQSSVSTTSDQLAKSKTSGTYKFVLPSDVTSEKVDELKKYYVQYFTTSFDAKSHEVTFVMTENESLNRRVMHRFFSGAGIRSVMVDGADMTAEQAFDKYIL